MSSELQKDAAATVTQESEGNDLLSKILSEGRLARNETQTEQATDMIKEFVQQVMQGELVMSRIWKPQSMRVSQQLISWFRHS